MKFPVVLIGLLFSTVVVAQNKSMLVSSSWLAGCLDDPKTVVLHVGSQKDYDAGHIPGARLVTLADISITGDRGLRLELPTVDVLAQAFGKFGIKDDSRIVVYPGTESVQSATRVWFTLDYLGLGDRTSLLDGGLSVWSAEGRPVSKETAKVDATTFKVQPRPDAVVDAAWIQSHHPQLIDARTPEFYTGASAGTMPRAGHIPGAKSVPFTAFFDENRKLKSADELRVLLTGKSMVTYCHIGQQATVPYFAARYLGLDVKLYDGSFQDWSMRSELPVETSTR